MAEEDTSAPAAAPQGGAQEGTQGTKLPRELRLMIATPAHGRTLYINCALSLANTTAVLGSRRIPYRIHSISDAIISRARNSIAAEFLADDRNWTHLVMIDSDVGFDPRDVFRMIAFDKGIVGCALPKRQFDVNAFPKGGAKTWDEAQAHLAAFTADIELNEGKMQAISGFVKARHVATAVMVVKRDTFTTMIEKGAVNKIRPDIDLPSSRGEQFYGFFEPMIDEDTGMYVGEDYSFCRRWRSIGGEVWCDVQGQYTHTGTYDFTGNLVKSLQARGAKVDRTTPPANNG